MYLVHKGNMGIAEWVAHGEDNPYEIQAATETNDDMEIAEFLAHREDNPYDEVATAATTGNVAMAQWLAHGEDNANEVQAAAETTANIIMSELEEHREDNPYEVVSAQDTFANMALEEWLAHREDIPYQVESSSDEILSDEAEQQTPPPVYSQVMKRKQDPPSTAHMVTVNDPVRIHDDSLREEVVYAKPQKATARSAVDTKPGTISFLYLKYYKVYQFVHLSLKA